MKFVYISLLYVLIPPSLYIILGKKIDVARDYFEFLGLYYGIGIILLVCYLILKEQKNQFDRDKKLQKKEKLDKILKSYQTANFILNSLLKNNKEKRLLSTEFRFLYSFIFIASPTLYSKDYFFLSKRQLILLEKSLYDISAPKIFEKLIEIIFLIDEIETSTVKIIENSTNIALKFNDCLDFMRKFDNSFLIPEVKNMKQDMEDLAKDLNRPVNLIALDNEFSFKDMKNQEEFLNIREKMGKLTTFFSQVDRKIFNDFLDCTTTINLMISMIYSPGEKRIYELVSDASKKLSNNIEILKKQIETFR